MIRSSTLINTRFKRAGEETVDYYSLIKNYVKTSTKQYYKHWIWYDEIEDFDRKLYKVYAYMNNTNNDTYSGKTRRFIHDRYNGSTVCMELLSSEIYVNIEESEDNVYRDNIAMLFEDVFSHIFKQLPHLNSRNVAATKNLHNVTLFHRKPPLISILKTQNHQILMDCS